MNKTKVRILFVTASTTGGGAERMLFNIIRMLDSHCISSLFITSNDELPPYVKDDLLTIRANKRHAINAFPRLLLHIRKFRPDYIFTTSSNIGYLLIIAKKLLRGNFKIVIRCAVTPSEIYGKSFKDRLLSSVIRMTYNFSDLVIAQTEFMREDLISTYRISRDRVRTIRNIVDKEFLKSMSLTYEPMEYEENNYNILAVGALYSVKGFDILIEAISGLIKGSNKHLYIIGQERYEQGYKLLLENQIRKLGLNANIHLIGPKDNPYPYFRKADLFIMSSRKEGYPNVVLEALAFGVPVVVTDVVDWTDVIFPGQNGYIARKKDVESLSETIETAFRTNFNTYNNNIINYNYNELFV